MDNVPFMIVRRSCDIVCKRMEKKKLCALSFIEIITQMTVNTHNENQAEGKNLKVVSKKRASSPYTDPKKRQTEFVIGTCRS